MLPADRGERARDPAGVGSRHAAHLLGWEGPHLREAGEHVGHRTVGGCLVLVVVGDGVVE